MGAQSPYNNQRENGEPCPQTGLKEAVPLHEIPALIIDLTIILVIAAGTTLLCKKIHLPSVLGYILAGFLAGPVVDFLPTIQDRGGIEVWSDIGVIFLMFGLGLEFSLHKLAEVGGPGLLSAGIQAAGMGGVGVLLGLALGWGPMNSLFLGVMLAMSSTMITMKNVEDLGMKEEKFAGLAMGTLVIEDLLAIFAMVVLSTIAVSQSISGWALAQRIGLLVLSLALWLILGIYLVPTLMKKLVGLMNDEVLLVFSLGLCFLMALLAQEIGLSTELGAFLAGSLLAGTVHAERVEHLVTPCKHLFGAVFFVSVGFMVQPAMIAQYIGPILLLSGAAIIGKLLFLTLGGLAAGQPLGVCLPAAAAQTQVGEFSFILAGLGQSLSVTGAFLYPVIVAVSVITTFTTPFLLRLAGPLQRGLERVLPQRCLAALDRYCQARGREKGEEGRDWTRFLQGYGRAFALYGVLAVGVILLGTQQLLPLLGDWLAPRWWLAELLTAGVIYLALAFLLPAMLRMKKRYFTALWLEKVSNRVILSGLMALRLGGGGPAGGGPGGDPLPGQPPVDVGGGPAGDLDGHPLGPAGRALPGGGGPVPGQLQRAEAGPALWPGGGGGPPVADPAALCDPPGLPPGLGPGGKDPPRPGLGQAGPRERPEGPPGPDPLEHPRGERGLGRGGPAGGHGEPAAGGELLPPAGRGGPYAGGGANDPQGLHRLPAGYPRGQAAAVLRGEPGQNHAPGGEERPGQRHQRGLERPAHRPGAGPAAHPQPRPQSDPPGRGPAVGDGLPGDGRQAAAPGPAGLKKRPKIGTPPSRYESTDWGVSFCAQFFGGKVYADVPLWTGFPPG